jgi:hypothetical protein
MKSTSAGTLSGCLIWLIVFAIASACLLPVAMVVGGVTSGTEFVGSIVGGIECPKGTTPQINRYATTSIDENGFEQPATGYELQCLDAGGNVVKTDAAAFAFIWIGILAVTGLAIAVLLAFALAAPAGVLIGRVLGRGKKVSPEPR